MINEASRTTLFLKYAKHFIDYSFAFEAKICKTKTLNKKLVVEHQVANLLRVKHGTFNHKIIDAGYQNPFDGYQMVKEPAFVIIFWYQHKNDKRFTMIDIDDWVKDESVSLTYERASDLATVSGNL